MKILTQNGRLHGSSSRVIHE